MADTSAIERKLEHLTSVLNDYLAGKQEGVSALNRDITLAGELISARVKVTISSADTTIIRAAALLYEDANYHVLRAYYHASPSLALIITTIVTIIGYVWKGIKILVDIINTIQELHIDDLLYEVWPWYREQIDKLHKVISDFSRELGWGVDGVMHLVNAVKGGREVIGGLLGRSPQEVEVEWADRTLEVMNKFSAELKHAQMNPGEFMSDVFSRLNKNSVYDTRFWWVEQKGWISGGLEKAEEALKGFGGITDELLQIREDMPAVVAKHIPQRIWDALEDTDNYINDRILPAISEINESLRQLRTIMDFNAGRMEMLAEKLSSPGDLLLGVDYLTDEFRFSQEQKIDEAASRETRRQADALLETMSGDLEEFELIDSAIKAPTKSPEFLTIETPARGAAEGIVMEERETWMIGGYEDQL